MAMDSAGDFVVAWQSYGQDGSGYGIYAQRYNSTGVAQGSEFRVNTYTTGIQEFPSIALDAAGDFVVSWESYQDGSNGGIYAQRYNAAGTALGSEFRVNTYTTGGQTVPAVAMDSAGDFAITWTSYSEDGSGAGIYAQRYNAAGTPQGSEFRVNTYTTGQEAFSSVAMDAEGDFVIDWASYNQESSGNKGIYAQRYNAGGVAQGSEFQVNTYTADSDYLPTVAMDSVGDFVIAYESNGEDGGGFGDFAQRYNSAGVAQGEEFRVNTYTTGNQELPSAAMDSAGDFILAWQSNTEDGSGYGVYAQRYVVQSETSVGMSGSEFRVNTYVTGNQIYSKVASDAAGDYVAVWQSSGEDGSGYGIYAQRYNSAGVAQGSEFGVNTYTTGAQGTTFSNGFGVAMDAEGDFVVAWQSAAEDGSGYGIYAQRYNSTGVAQGSEFRVNTYTTGNQITPSVAMDSAGDFVVTWASYGEDGSQYGIYAQRYNAAGVPQASEFRVNTYTTGGQRAPFTAMDSAGDFVIAWESSGEDGSALYGIYAQRYSKAGVAEGSEFQVNTYATFNQIDAAVAMDSAGDFVVTWTSFFEDGSGGGIYAQRYNAAGGAQGSQFQVNTYTTNTQEWPSVAVDAAGDYVIAWESFGEDGSRYGIYAQRYNASGTTQGSEFRVNTYTSYGQRFSAVAMDSDGDFVVVWASEEDGSGYGVYQQRYSAFTTPVVTTSNGALPYTANSGAQAVDAALTLADGDNALITSATVTISSGYASGEDVLGLTTQNGITGSFNSVSGALTLTGTASVASYQAALESVTYTDTLHDASTAARTISFLVNDGISVSNTAAKTVNPQADVATQLVITSQPPSSVTAGSGFGFIVTAEDANNNVVTSFTGSETVALASNSGNSTLGGTLTVTAVNGVATFSGLTLNNAASGYTLQVTSGSLTAATSNSVSVTAAVATFTDASPSLNLAINTDDQVSVISTGTSYQFTLASGVWSGANDADVTGNGSSTLTVTSAGISAFTSAINITDTGSTGGDALTFNNSLASGYFNNFAVTLTNATASSALVFNGATNFENSASLTAAVNGSVVINAGATLTSNTGSISLDATGTNVALTAGGNVISQSGAVTLEATGNVTVASGVTVNSGTANLTLAADVTAAGQGDDGVGTLTVGAGATVTTTGTVSLRGADVSIDTSSNPAVIGGTRGAGHHSQQFALGRAQYDSFRPGVRRQRKPVCHQR